MAQLENIEAIEKRLWSAADNLRANSNYASNEYFMPVMGLIFLRHAYSRYLGVKGDIEANLPKRGGKVRALTKEDFSQKGSIYLRPEAEFDYLVALPDSANRAKAIQHAMETIEEDYQDLKGVLVRDQSVYAEVAAVRCAAILISIQEFRFRRILIICQAALPGTRHSQNVQPLTGPLVIAIAAADGVS